MTGKQWYLLSEKGYYKSKYHKNKNLNEVLARSCLSQILIITDQLFFFVKNMQLEIIVVKISFDIIGIMKKTEKIVGFSVCDSLYSNTLTRGFQCFCGKK